jgi:hypothetical protein
MDTPEHPHFVMAGLDPAIHVLLFQSRTKKVVNAQDIWRENALLPGGVVCGATLCKATSRIENIHAL